MTRMDFDKYQEWTRKTAIYENDSKLYYLALGLAGEAGEVANKIKKVIRDDGGNPSIERQLGIIDEIGDCLWYIARLCDELGYPLNKAVEMNIDKLEKRLETNKISGDGDNR